MRAQVDWWEELILRTKQRFLFIYMKMFVLAEMCDVVRIEPRRFAQDMGQEINDELNKKFANKVRYRNEIQSS